MKNVKVLTIIVFLLILIQGFNYINLMVSEKYETQLEGIIEITKDVQEKVDEKYHELQKKKKNIKIYSIVLILVFVCLIVVWGRKSFSITDDKSNTTGKKLNK